MTEVRYQGQSDDVLRHVLVTVWNDQCYWCHRLFWDEPAQIDHIVPQDCSEDTLATMKHKYGLAGDFDVHLPYNLAPIHASCNGRKSNRDLTNLPVIGEVLDRAKKLAPEVQRRVRAFENRRGLSAALLKAAEVDLSDEKTREAFKAGAPAIVQRLISLGADMADFFVSRKMTIEIDDQRHRLELTLNERGRALVTVFEEVADGDLEIALRAPIAEFAEQIGSLATSAMERADAMRGADVEPLVATGEFVVDHIELRRAPPMLLEFTLTGAFFADGSTTIARDREDGDGVEYIQGDATVTGRFTVVLSWGADDPPGQFTVDDATLVDEYTDVSNQVNQDHFHDVLYGTDPAPGESW